MSESFVKERLANFNQEDTDFNIATVNKYGIKQEKDTDIEEAEDYYQEVIKKSESLDIEIKIKEEIDIKHEPIQAESVDIKDHLNSILLKSTFWQIWTQKHQKS